MLAATRAPQPRRLVGLDLGIASAHTAVILDQHATELARCRCHPTPDSFAALEARALAGAPPQVRLEVVIEPTGPAWLPVAIWFGARGHSVYRVASAKAADLRRFLHRHAKANTIDAATLARLGLVDPDGLHPVELPGAVRAALDRHVRACDRLTRLAAEHKARIKDLVGHLLPASPLRGDLGQADLAVLERYADPARLLAADPARLTRLIARTSNGQQGSDRAQAWREAARNAVAIYDGDPAIAAAALAAEVASEIRLLRATLAELDQHRRARETCYTRVDPEQLGRTVPGLAEVGGPLIVAAIGRPGRFANGRQVRSFTGLAPRASETGNTDRKGQPMSKAGNRRLRAQLIRSADTARRQDPQLAKLYHTQMTQRGANHLKALCVVAAHLAERAWQVLARGTPYVVCDTDGTPVTPAQAKQIIAERYTVPEQVRRRRRSTKTTTKAGKAPHQVLAGHARAHSAATRRPSPALMVRRPATRVKAASTSS